MKDFFEPLSDDELDWLDSFLLYRIDEGADFEGKDEGATIRAFVVAVRYLKNAVCTESGEMFKPFLRTLSPLKRSGDTINQTHRIERIIEKYQVVNCLY